MKTPDQFNNLWSHIDGKDWQDNLFSIEKAYVCALLSELAYYNIPNFEVKDAERVNLIPCVAYPDIKSSSNTNDFNDIMRSFEFNSYFIIERKYAVVTGVVTPKVIFIAIRGTAQAYDWLTNLNIGKYSYNRDISFHKGFYKSVATCIKPICQELSKILKDKELPPVYICGHSLGGAMAAILNAVWYDRDYYRNSCSNWCLYEFKKPHSCYTYGMPKYGNFHFIDWLQTPFHFYNKDDIVPTVPPSLLGYEACFEEYRLDGKSIENTRSREVKKFINWIASLAAGKQISDHAIELYRGRIAELV